MNKNTRFCEMTYDTGKVSSFLCAYELSAEELMARGEGWNGR